MKCNFQFSKKQEKALDKLSDELNTTRAEVLKIAFALLETVVEEKKNGNDVGIVKDHKEVKKIIGIFNNKGE